MSLSSIVSMLRDLIVSVWKKIELMGNFEIIKNHVAIYTFAGAAEIQSYLKNKGVRVQTS